MAGCDTTPTQVSELEQSLIDASVADSNVGLSDANTTDARLADASIDLCGNGIIDDSEICDPGINLCCNPSCDGATAENIVCRPAQGSCDLAEFCDGQTTTCPGDAAAPVVCGDGFICGIETCDDGIFPPEESDGCDPICQVELGANCTGEPSICNFTPTFPSELVITEIHKAPLAVSGGAGEWFEVYNPTPLAFDLFGLEITDLISDSFTINQPLLLPPGGYVVFGNNSDLATNGGVAVDFEYSGFELDDDDQIIISNVAEAMLIDQVAYDSKTFPNTPGATLSFDLLFVPTDDLDNDSGLNWCTASIPYGDGDFGTPGSDNMCAPVVTANSVDDAFFLPTGASDFSIGAATIPLFVDNDFQGGGWILVGRGRDGWAWNNLGAGAPDTVKDNIGTTNAFTPTYLSSALIQELIDNSINGLDLTLIEIRVRRAAAANGTNFQEGFWIPISQTTWTWIFDGGGPANAAAAPFGFDVDFSYQDSDLGLGGFIGTANTEDTIEPISTGFDDYSRIFTWASTEHSGSQGFAYGASVMIGDASAASFTLNTGAGHSMPYTEVYIRGLPTQPSLVSDESVSSEFASHPTANSTAQDQR